MQWKKTVQVDTTITESDEDVEGDINGVQSIFKQIIKTVLFRLILGAAMENLADENGNVVTVVNNESSEACWMSAA